MNFARAVNLLRHEATLADAILKVSWRRTPFGAVVPGPDQTEGGVCATCFTLESGITLSCAHNMRGLFVPNIGFHACRVFVAESSGRITELHDGCLQLFPDYDACVIAGFQSGTRYHIARRKVDQIHSCHLRGYEANTGPFQSRVTPDGRSVEIHSANISSVAQTFNALIPRPIIFQVNSADVKVNNKPGYILDTAAKVGLSGGPMLDAADATVAGLCFIGLPADAHQKTQIGAIDVRQFPFI